MLDYILKKTGLSRNDKKEPRQDVVPKKESNMDSKHGPIATEPKLEAQDDTTSFTPVIGIRVSGKQWKVQKKPLRAKSLGVQKKSWDQKRRVRIHLYIYI